MLDLLSVVDSPGGVLVRLTVRPFGRGRSAMMITRLASRSKGYFSSGASVTSVIVAPDG